MTQLRTSDAWRLFSFNWVPIGLMAVALVLGLALTDFSIKPASMLFPYGSAALYAGVALYNAHRSRKGGDPLVVYVLGSTAQILFITLLMTPLTYIAAASALPLTDGSLAYLDRALGLDWRAYLYFFYDHPRLIPGLDFGYRMIALPVFIIPMALTLGRRYRRLQEFTLAFSLALIATTVISIFTPAVGAYGELGIDPNSVLSAGGYLDTLRDLPPVRDGSLRELNVGALSGIITFPSFHAAAAALYLWALWSVWWMRPFALIANGAMLVATPVGGGHYFVDVFAGVAVAVLAIFAALRLCEWLIKPAAQPLAAEYAPALAMTAAKEAIETP